MPRPGDGSAESSRGNGVSTSHHQKWEFMPVGEHMQFETVAAERPDQDAEPTESQEAAKLRLLDGFEARLTGPQGSGILTSMVLANALLVIPEGQFETPAGATVRAIVLDDPVHQAEPAF